MSRRRWSVSSDWCSREPSWVPGGESALCRGGGQPPRATGVVANLPGFREESLRYVEEAVSRLEWLV